MKLKLYANQRYVNAAVLNMHLKIQEFGLDNLCFVTILKGGVYTAHKIFSMLPFKESDNVIFGYLGLSSYGDDVYASDYVKVTYPLDLSAELVRNRDVWIIDDVVDSSRTVDEATHQILRLEPNSIKVAVLVDKVKNRERYGMMEDPPEAVGFVYEGDNFLVGCGMGLGERFRGLHSLYEVVKEDEL